MRLSDWKGIAFHSRFFFQSKTRRTNSHPSSIYHSKTHTKDNDIHRKSPYNIRRNSDDSVVEMVVSCVMDIEEDSAEFEEKRGKYLFFEVGGDFGPVSQCAFALKNTESHEYLTDFRGYTL